MRDWSKVSKTSKIWATSFKTASGMEACATTLKDIVGGIKYFVSKPQAVWRHARLDSLAFENAPEMQFQNRKRYGGMRDFSLNLDRVTRFIVSKPQAVWRHARLIENFVLGEKVIRKCFKTASGMEACATIIMMWLIAKKGLFQNRKRYGGMRDSGEFSKMRE